MVPVSHLLAFAGVAALVVAVPGPSVAFTISRALSNGRRVALWNVVGNAVGLLAQVTAVAFGLGVVIQRSADVFTAVKFIGAGYLVYLGIQAIRHRRALAEALDQPAAPLRPARALFDGMVVGVMNPKTIAFFVVALPSFTVPAMGHLSVQLLTLGIVFPAIAVVLDSVWALVAGTARQWLACSPRRLAVIGGTSGVVMIGLGVSLAATGRKN